MNGLTIPSNIVIKQQRPDIVLIDKSATPHTVWLFELSVSFERNIEQALTRKKNRYAYLEQDTKDAGYNCLNIPLKWAPGGTSLSQIDATFQLCTNLPHPRPS